VAISVGLNKPAFETNYSTRLGLEFQPAVGMKFEKAGY
jgi:hypothetical protein